MAEQLEAAVLDTSVVVDLGLLPFEALPRRSAVTAVTMAELAAGPHATAAADVRAARQDRLQRVEASFDPLPFDAMAARAYGRLYAREVERGRKPRGARALDLMIAAIALTHALPLLTRDPGDFAAVAGLVEVHAV